MNLTSRENDKLPIGMAVIVARRVPERGVKAGATAPTGDRVMDGFAEMIHDVRVEATFLAGIKLVAVHEPIG